VNDNSTSARIAAITEYSENAEAKAPMFILHHTHPTPCSLCWCSFNSLYHRAFVHSAPYNSIPCRSSRSEVQVLVAPFASFILCIWLVSASVFHAARHTWDAFVCLPMYLQHGLQWLTRSRSSICCM
jgi:hypothetical protein